MQKITPFLWFDNNAEEAIDFYISIFKNSKVLSVTRYGEAGPGAKGTVMTAEFQIAAIEFTPLFEIASIVLNSTSKKVSMQLPGAGPSSIDNAPVFEIENVLLGGGSELGLIQVTPGRSA